MLCIYLWYGDLYGGVHGGVPVLVGGHVPVLELMEGSLAEGVTREDFFREVDQGDNISLYPGGCLADIKETINLEHPSLSEGHLLEGVFPPVFIVESFDVQTYSWFGCLDSLQHAGHLLSLHLVPEILGLGCVVEVKNTEDHTDDNEDDGEGIVATQKVNITNAAEDKGEAPEPDGGVDKEDTNMPLDDTVGREFVAEDSCVDNTEDKTHTKEYQVTEPQVFKPNQVVERKADTVCLVILAISKL